MDSIYFIISFAVCFWFILWFLFWSRFPTEVAVYHGCHLGKELWNGWRCDLASDNVRQWNVQKLRFTDSWRSNCISVMRFHVHFSKHLQLPQLRTSCQTSTRSVCQTRIKGDRWWVGWRWFQSWRVGFLVVKVNVVVCFKKNILRYWYWYS